MIVFDNVWKYQRSRLKNVPALAGITCVFERPGNVAILCQDSEDASLLINLLTGTDRPDLGRITRHGRISWPMGELVASKGSLTVRDNLRFIARIYGVNEDGFINYIDEVVGFGASLNKPLSSLGRFAKQMTSYAAVLAIPFDWYIMPGEIKGPDRASTSMLKEAFRSRLKDASAIIITDDVETALAYGTAGVLFRNGRFDFVESLDQAARLHLGSG